MAYSTQVGQIWAVARNAQDYSNMVPHPNCSAEIWATHVFALMNAKEKFWIVVIVLVCGTVVLVLSSLFGYPS